MNQQTVTSFLLVLLALGLLSYLAYSAGMGWKGLLVITFAATTFFLFIRMRQA
ncbi:hypothetical protein [Calothrix sp. 336/3]|uniref:hypothetical protein n=1 Tax=Calothrix sp. 336/3 TaxID=1337936 RepID=UPI000AE45A7A|nr:hypothetical protein [Calothrix sp. 336/3]